jgi:Pyruvate/2-oxoacid:ferredoxin oxidoreductase delta subunit
MKLLLLATLLALSAAIHDDAFVKFNEFVVKYNKQYESLGEFENRFQIFKNNLVKIARQNAEHVAIGGGEVFGVNVFADMTAEEFSVRLMKNLPYRAPDNTTYTFTPPAPNTLVDWRTKGVVTPVKDQGQCGSCWAHSADEAVESFDAIVNKRATALELSQQQCTACTYTYNGCNGGWPHDAYGAAIADRNGIDSMNDYPYNIAQAGNCKFGAKGPADKPQTTDKGYKSPTKGSLQSNLDTTGPVSVCVAADAWQTYSSGVLKSCPGSVDHCVQAVGYNSDASETYWIVRNSWGTGWGVKGYIYLDMTADSGDICHIQEYMTYPTF